MLMVLTRKYARLSVSARARACRPRCRRHCLHATRAFNKTNKTHRLYPTCAYNIWRCYLCLFVQSYATCGQEHIVCGRDTTTRFTQKKSRGIECDDCAPQFEPHKNRWKIWHSTWVGIDSVGRTLKDVTNANMLPRQWVKMMLVVSNRAVYLFR